VEKEAQEEKIIYTRCELEHLICQAMGGRAAELLYYGEADGLSTGVGSDLRHATGWAERMIREFGMCDEIGQVFLDARYLQDGPLAAKASEAAQRIVRAQLDEGLRLLQAYREELDRLSGELLLKNRLTRSDLMEILGPAPAPARVTGDALASTA
jgi:ATP-dependent Zn protease